MTGYNRTLSKVQWLIDRGMQWAESPRAVCEAADVIFSMVTDAAALAAALVIDSDGVNKDGKTLRQHPQYAGGSVQLGTTEGEKERT